MSLQRAVEHMNRSFDSSPHKYVRVYTWILKENFLVCFCHTQPPKVCVSVGFCMLHCLLLYDCCSFIYLVYRNDWTIRNASNWDDFSLLLPCYYKLTVKAYVSVSVVGIWPSSNLMRALRSKSSFSLFDLHYPFHNGTYVYYSSWCWQLNFMACIHILLSYAKFYAHSHTHTHMVHNTYKSNTNRVLCVMCGRISKSSAISCEI